MMSGLFHNIAYKLHRVGFYMYSVKYYYMDHCHGMSKIKCLFESIITNLKIFNYRYGYYEYLEIPITTRCSLRCKYCSNLIPYYKKKCDYDSTILINGIKTFLRCIHNIVYVRVLGGEPFLSKNLYRVLRVLLKSNKIQRIEVVTNGTIVPTDERIISILKNKRIIVCISRYPIVDYRKLVVFLKENGIRYRLDKMHYWMNYGNTKKRNKTKKELMKQYASCNHVCKSLVNGQIHLCPRSSHGTDLGIIKNNKNDYLDLLDETMSIREKKKRINDLFRKKYIMACDYCDYGTKKCKKIKVAEQIK